MVQFTDTGTENVYNLAFSDYDEKTGEDYEAFLVTRKDNTFTL